MSAPGNSNLEEITKCSHCLTTSTTSRGDPASFNTNSTDANNNNASVELIEPNPSTKTLDVAIKDVLRGYGLYSLEAKRAALLDFVKIPYPVAVFTSANIRTKVKALLSVPKDKYEREKAKKPKEPYGKKAPNQQSL